jgi:hypothetical protein
VGEQNAPFYKCIPVGACFVLSPARSAAGLITTLKLARPHSVFAPLISSALLCNCLCALQKHPKMVNHESSYCLCRITTTEPIGDLFGLLSGDGSAASRDCGVWCLCESVVDSKKYEGMW